MRLIDADEFRKEVQEYVLPITTNNLMGAADAYHRIMHLLDDAPTIEAEPVKRGRWTVLDECANAGAYCSVCHKKVYKECYGNCKMRSAYCPNCGAKMDGKDNNND